MKSKPKAQHEAREPSGRNWQIFRIKDVARINPATRIPKNQLVDFFPMDAIGVNGGLSHGLQKQSNEANGYSQFKNDDVLFAKVTPCFENEKSAIGRDLAVGVATATTEVTVLRPRTNITSEFLHYRIKGLDFAVGGRNKMKGSAGLKRVPEKFAADFRFELPEIDEQRRIAAWLDLQTTRIDKRRELLAKKRELLRDLRSNLVGETLASGLHGQETTPTGLVDLPALPMGWQASHTKRLLRFITSGSRG
jgi:restriction endonuclease S subunit